MTRHLLNARATCFQQDAHLVHRSEPKCCAYVQGALSASIWYSVCRFKNHFSLARPTSLKTNFFLKKTPYRLQPKTRDCIVFLLSAVALSSSSSWLLLCHLSFALMSSFSSSTGYYVVVFLLSWLLLHCLFPPLASYCFSTICCIAIFLLSWLPLRLPSTILSFFSFIA